MPVPSPSHDPYVPLCRHHPACHVRSCVCLDPHAPRWSTGHCALHDHDPDGQCPRRPHYAHGAHDHASLFLRGRLFLRGHRGPVPPGRVHGGLRDVHPVCHHHASAADRRSLRDHGHHGLSGDSRPGRGHHGRDYDLSEMLKVHGVYERSRGAANYLSVRVQDLQVISYGSFNQDPYGFVRSSRPMNEDRLELVRIHAMRQLTTAPIINRLARFPPRAALTLTLATSFTAFASFSTPACQASPCS